MHEAHDNAKSRGFHPPVVRQASDYAREFLDNHRSGSTFHDLAEMFQRALDEKPRAEAQLIALEHSELSEALEAIRAGNPESLKIAPFSQVEEELADLVIRVCDHAATEGYDLAGAVLAKMAYNRSRPRMHGGKKF